MVVVAEQGRVTMALVMIVALLRRCLQRGRRTQVQVRAPERACVRCAGKAMICTAMHSRMVQIKACISTLSAAAWGRPGGRENDKESLQKSDLDVCTPSCPERYAKSRVMDAPAGTRCSVACDLTACLQALIFKRW